MCGAREAAKPSTKPQSHGGQLIVCDIPDSSYIALGQAPPEKRKRANIMFVEGIRRAGGRATGGQDGPAGGWTGGAAGIPPCLPLLGMGGVPHTLRSYLGGTPYPIHQGG